MIKAHDGVMVYGYLQTPEEIEQERIDKQMGIVRHHETTYLEYSIPKELEKELEEMVDKRLAEFEQQCQCEYCKNNRK